MKPTGKENTMFRQMRRANQQLSHEESCHILHECSSGVLALSGDEGYPYALPISYVFTGEKLIFHCAKTGHKIDAVRRCEKASFCVIAKDDVQPEEYTTRYRSVIVFGRMRILENEDLIISAATALAEKYYPGHLKEHEAYIARYLSSLCVMEMDIEHISGKESKELMLARKK